MGIDHRGMTFPPTLGPDAGLATVDPVDSVRAMLEQILFTEPGERVNRPSFGVGARGAVFEPNSPFLQTRIRVALEENVWAHLGHGILIHELSVDTSDAALVLRIRFEIRGRVGGPHDLALSVPHEVGR